MHPLYAQTVFITLIFKQKMKKGIHPENYRPVVFKDTTLVRASSLTPQVVLISS